GLEPPQFSAPSEDTNETEVAEVEIDWRNELTPRGKETRLGEAIRHVVNQQRGNPVAGIVVVSDGQGKAGVRYNVGALAAQDAGIPVSTIAVGGGRPPVTLRVVDLEAPPRVYPGDKCG